MIEVEDRDGVALIRLRHGKVNAMDLDLVRAIIRTFAELRPDRPVVLTGSDRSFSAGVDLARLLDGGPTYARSFVSALSEAFMAVYNHPGPVVAAVNGHAIAGGCVLAAACDLRLASSGKLGLVELSVGVPLPVAAFEISAAVLGARLRELLLSSRLLDVEEARNVGLIDELVDAGGLIDAALTRARRLAATPHTVFAMTKMQFQAVTRARISAASELDPEITALWASEPVLDAVRRSFERL